MKKSASLLAILCVSLVSFSQNITGSWYGRADVEMQGLHNNYLTELVLKQHGNEVEGVFGYYFKNMYQSFFVRGTYDKKTRQIRIKNIPLIHFQSNNDFRIDCPMDFEATLMVSRAKSSLQGFFMRQDKYKHTCPVVRVNYSLDGNELNQDSILKNTIAGIKIWSPLPEDVVYTETTKSQNASPATANPNTNANTSATNTPAAVEDQQKIINQYEARKNVFQKEIYVSTDSLRVSFYDNGDIDGDSISVFMNGQPVVTRKELDVRGLNLYLKLDAGKEINEITMFAENLGKFPPNTALMIVYDGEVRNEIYLSSSLSQNATVRIRRKR